MANISDPAAQNIIPAPGQKYGFERSHWGEKGGQLTLISLGRKVGSLWGGWF